MNLQNQRNEFPKNPYQRNFDSQNPLIKQKESKQNVFVQSCNQADTLSKCIPQNLLADINGDDDCSSILNDEQTSYDKCPGVRRKESSACATNYSSLPPLGQYYSNVDKLGAELRNKEVIHSGGVFKHRSSLFSKTSAPEAKLIYGLQGKTKILSSSDVPEVSEFCIDTYSQQGEQPKGNINFSYPMSLPRNLPVGPNCFMVAMGNPGLGLPGQVCYGMYPNNYEMKPKQEFSCSDVFPANQVYNPPPDFPMSSIQGIRVDAPIRPQPRHRISCPTVFSWKFEEPLGLPPNESIRNTKKALSSGQKWLPENMNSEDNDLYSSEPSLEEFIHKSKEDFISYIKTQKGSRLLQYRLKGCTEEEVDRILEKISTDIQEIMCESYGNYFMQKLIERSNARQRLFILNNMIGNFLEIANHSSGTHSIQSLIENMTEEEEGILISECVEKHIMKISLGSNSTHIIQKMISQLPEKKRSFLNIFVLENLKKLCLNANGICVVKKLILENRDPCIAQKLLSALEKDCLEITEDQYGNYAIQYSLEVYGATACAGIIHIICDNLVRLSNQKFSSNVVEKIIIILSKTHWDDFNHILNDLYICTTNFLALLKNKYGYFVLQNTVVLMSPLQKTEIYEHLTRINVNGAKEKIKMAELMKLM